MFPEYETLNEILERVEDGTAEFSDEYCKVEGDVPGSLTLAVHELETAVAAVRMMLDIHQG